MKGISQLLVAHKERFGAPMKVLFGQVGEGVRHIEASLKLRTVITPGSGASKALINSKTKVDFGVSDFDGNKLDAEKVFTVTHIRLGYDSHADAGMEALLSYKKAPVPAVRNAVLTFEQDGAKYLEREVSLLINGDTERSVKDGIVQLATPIVIVGGIPFDYAIRYPEGAEPVAGGLTQYLETLFIGFETIRSAKAQ